MEVDDTTTVPNPIYAQVKAWIAQKEAYELQHQRRAPLTPAQRNALEALRMLSPRLPAVGHTNWVGWLNDYRQATAPTRPPDRYDEQESGTVLAGGTRGRICRVEVSDDGGLRLRRPQRGGTTTTTTGGGGWVFPSPGAGLLSSMGDPALVPGGGTPHIPVFSTKKKAKQYAARCAVEFLIKHRYMPADIQLGVQRQVAADDANAEVAAGATSAAGLVPFPEGGTMAPEEAGEDDDDDAEHTTESGGGGGGGGGPRDLVRTLCASLGFPAPRYLVTPLSFSSYSRHTFFDGRADFPNDVHDAHNGELLALCEHAHLNGFAAEEPEAVKDAVAGRLLERLREIEAERAAQLAAMGIRVRTS